MLRYVADKFTFPDVSKKETSSSSRAGRLLMASVNSWRLNALRSDVLHYRQRCVTTQQNWINTNAVQTSYLHISTVNFTVQCETYGSARRNTRCCFARQKANRLDSLRIRCRRPKLYPKCSPWTSHCLCIPPVPLGATVPSGPGPPLFRYFTITLRQTTVLENPLDKWSTRLRDLYLTTHMPLCIEGVPWVKVNTSGYNSRADAKSRTSYTHRSNWQRFRSYGFLNYSN